MFKLAAVLAIAAIAQAQQPKIITDGKDMVLQPPKGGTVKFGSAKGATTVVGLLKADDELASAITAAVSAASSEAKSTGQKVAALEAAVDDLGKLGKLTSDELPIIKKSIETATEKLELRLLKIETSCDATTQFEKTPSSGTTTSTFKKPVCAALRVCKFGKEFVSGKPTRTSDRKCTPARVCKANEYSAKSLAPDSNRECKAFTVCKAGSEYEAAAPGGGGDEPTNRKCAKATVCAKLQTETVKLSATADRKCEDLPIVTQITKVGTSVFVPPSNTCPKGKTMYARVLIVAGGAGGGGRSGAGGGAGGLIAHERLPVKCGAGIKVKVGKGGNGGAGTGRWGYNGDTSMFGSLVAIGGGGGGSDGQSRGQNGGSAGGGKYGHGSGTALQRSRSGDSGRYGKGNNGGSGTRYTWNAGGGGGAGGAGLSGTGSRCGNGGVGFRSTITGTPVTYAGGGGGGSHDPKCQKNTGLGGAGGGGKANVHSGGGKDAGSPGKDGLGGGGGGGSTPGGNGGAGGKGGSGVVIVKCCMP